MHSQLANSANHPLEVDPTDTHYKESEAEKVFDSEAKTTQSILMVDHSSFCKHNIRRGSRIVRDRCLTFMQILGEEGYRSQIPLEQAKEMFQIHMNIFDQKSLKSYFGTVDARSIKRIERFARYDSGFVSRKTIELSTRSTFRKGYLELMRLATYQKRGNTWFMVINNEGSIVPELSSTHYEESKSKVSMDNFSLPILQGKEREKTAREVVSPRNMETTGTQQTHTHLVGEREIGRVKVKTGPICLTAYPSESAKDGRTDDPG